jgi:hypothetical protein
MGDTAQNVQWALEQKCLLRDSEESVILPSAAMDRVGLARAYSDGLRERQDGFGVFGEILCTSWTYGDRPEGRKGEPSPIYPLFGYVIADELARFGGPEALFKMCHACPANVRPHDIAECVGSICQMPDSPEAEEQLRGIVSRLGLEDELERAFPATTPLWYGLWAISPVPPASLPLLKILFSAILEEDRRDAASGGGADAREFRRLSTFISAIELAQERGLQLHVTLLPLGHADLGRYTIFPHCPFCKAFAPGKRWPRRYPSELHTCEVCGTRFSPAETASVRQMNVEGLDDIDLRKILGPEKFRRFAREFLIARGETPEAADGIVETTESEERRREEQHQRDLELSRRKKQFLEEHVYKGLPCLHPPKWNLVDDPEDEKEEESPSGSTEWFDAENIAEVLRRCQRLGIAVTFMHHYSSDHGETHRESKNLKAPLEILRRWQAEGCHEKFRAVLCPPDSLMRSASDSKS